MQRVDAFLVERRLSAVEDMLKLGFKSKALRVIDETMAYLSVRESDLTGKWKEAVIQLMYQMWAMVSDSQEEVVTLWQGNNVTPILTKRFKSSTSYMAKDGV